MLYIIFATMVLLALVLPAWENLPRRDIIPGWDPWGVAPLVGLLDEGVGPSMKPTHIDGDRFHIKWYTGVLGDE